MMGSSMLKHDGFYGNKKVKAQTDGWRLTMKELQTAVIKAGGWAWAWFLP